MGGMNPARAIACVGITLIGVAAQASFEMMLVMHRFEGRRQISRWDAPSGRFLGSFGRNLDLSTLGMGQDGFDGSVVVPVVSGSSIGYRRIDYSTGENRGVTLTNSSNTTLNRFSAATNGLLFFAGDFGGQEQIRVFDRAMNLQRTLTHSPNLGFLDIAQAENGTIYSITREQGSSSGFKYLLNRYSTTATSPSTTITIADNAGSDTFYGTLSISGNRLIVGGLNTTQARAYSIALSVPQFTGTMGGSFARTVITEFGHSDSLYGFGFDATAGEILMSGGSWTTRTWSDVMVEDNTRFADSVIYGGHMVVAPEPGTMLALGTGLAAVIARRRKRST